MANKVIYGLKNVHVATVTVTVTTGGTSVTFGTPQAIPGAVNLSIDAEGDSTTFYADNSAYWVGIANNGYTGTLELAEVPDFFRKDFLGETEDTAHGLVEKNTDAPKFFALLFEFDGDDSGRKYVFYYCKAGRPTIAGQTTEDSITPKTQELSFSAIPLPGSGIIKKASTPTSTDLSTWYTTVALPTFSS